jgi:hypothetical protein
MLVYSAIFFMNLILNENLKNPKDKLLTLYILLLHVIEYYFYVDWNILIEIWNTSY